MKSVFKLLVIALLVFGAGEIFGWLGMDRRIARYLYGLLVVFLVVQDSYRQFKNWRSRRS